MCVISETVAVEKVDKAFEIKTDNVLRVFLEFQSVILV